MKPEKNVLKLITVVLIQLVLLDIILIILVAGQLYKSGNISFNWVKNLTVSSHVKKNAAALETPANETKPENQSSTSQPFHAPTTFHAPAPKIIESDKFTATAYDLSYACCGKYPSHPQYGITFSGKKAVKGRTVAVDPEVIPLGSKIHIEFPQPYTQLNGWYVAEDTGNMVKGNIIDVFFGESAFREMKSFGRRKVKVKIVLSD